VQAQNRLLSQTLRIAKAANNAFGGTLTSPWYWLQMVVKQYSCGRRR